MSLREVSPLLCTFKGKNWLSYQGLSAHTFKTRLCSCMALGLTLASALVTCVTDILLIQSVNIKAHCVRYLVTMATNVLQELTVQGRT